MSKERELTGVIGRVNKDLAAIEWLETKCYVESPQEEKFEECVNIIKQSLLKAQEQEKVLEILKTKEVDINYLKTLIPFYKTIEGLQSVYNISFIERCKLTIDETKIIKEWLENETRQRTRIYQW